MVALGGAGGDGPCPLCAGQTPQQRHPSRQVVVHVATTEPTRGEWCPHCLLPSVWVFPLVHVCEHGWHLGRVGGMGSVSICDECGRRAAQ
jgi:hypothetical protein